MSISLATVCCTVLAFSWAALASSCMAFPPSACAACIWAKVTPGGGADVVSLDSTRAMTCSVFSCTTWACCCASWVRGSCMAIDSIVPSRTCS